MPLKDVPAPPIKRVKGHCGLGRYLERLDEADRTVLQSWLDSEEWGHTAIMRELEDQNMDPTFAVDMIRRHRIRECACYR